MDDELDLDEQDSILRRYRLNQKSCGSLLLQTKSLICWSVI